MKLRLSVWAQCCATVLLAIAILAGCNEPAKTSVQPSPDLPLRIVSSFPQKGTAAIESKLMVQAIDLAISERNISQGKPVVEHIKLDGGSTENGEWSPHIETDNATRAAGDPQVIAYIGPYTSGATGVALPITNRAHLLTLGPTATWPGLTLDGWESGEAQKYYPSMPRNFARLALPDSRQAEAAARWAKSLGLRRTYVLDDGSSYSNGLASQFVKTSQEIGLQVVAQRKYDTKNGVAIQAQLKSSSADAVYFAPSNVSNALQVADLLATDHSVANVFVSDTALNDTLLSSAGDKLRLWHVTYNGAKDVAEPQRADFLVHYRTEYGAEPSMAAANAYDLAKLTLAAIDALPTPSRDAITERVLKTQNYEGASGTISFDNRGDRISSRIEGFIVGDGRFVLDRILQW